MARIRTIEEKPELRMTTGLMEAALVEARHSPADRFADAFRDSFRARLAALPCESVQTELAGMRAGIELASANSVLGWARPIPDQAGTDRALRDDRTVPSHAPGAGPDVDFTPAPRAALVGQ